MGCCGVHFEELGLDPVSSVGPQSMVEIDPNRPIISGGCRRGRRFFGMDKKGEFVDSGADATFLFGWNAKYDPPGIPNIDAAVMSLKTSCLSLAQVFLAAAVIIVGTSVALYNAVTSPTFQYSTCINTTSTSYANASIANTSSLYSIESRIVAYATFGSQAVILFEFCYAVGSLIFVCCLLLLANTIAWIFGRHVPLLFALASYLIIKLESFNLLQFVPSTQTLDSVSGAYKRYRSFLESCDFLSERCCDWLPRRTPNFYIFTLRRVANVANYLTVSLLYACLFFGPIIAGLLALVLKIGQLQVCLFGALIG